MQPHVEVVPHSGENLAFSGERDSIARLGLVAG